MSRCSTKVRNKHTLEPDVSKRVKKQTTEIISLYSEMAGKESADDKTGG